MSAKVSGEMVRESDTVGKPMRKVSAGTRHRLI